jgi:hypothetical protein
MMSMACWQKYTVMGLYVAATMRLCARLMLRRWRADVLRLICVITRFSYL